MKNKMTSKSYKKTYGNKLNNGTSDTKKKI